MKNKAYHSYSNGVNYEKYPIYYNSKLIQKYDSTTNSDQIQEKPPWGTAYKEISIYWCWARIVPIEKSLYIEVFEWKLFVWSW